MHRRNSILTLLVMGCLALMLLAGCSVQSRDKTLSFLLDGYKQGPPPPTRRVRRDLLQEIDDLKVDLAKAQRAAEAANKARRNNHQEEQIAAEQAKTWPQVADLLPKDNSGQVDWVQALQTKAIAPRPGLTPRAPEQGVLDLDVELTSSPNELFWVTFSHADHTPWLSCTNCHPEIFSLKRGEASTVVTMAQIQAGKSCGVCHGSVAFGLDACGRCHGGTPAVAESASEEPRTPIERARSWAEAKKLLPAAKAGPDWSKALDDGVIDPRPGIDPTAKDQDIMALDIEMVPEGSVAFKVVFSHAAHTVWLGCDSCHPALFEMATGTTPITMANIQAGKTCGVCHGPVAFGVEACSRCHPTIAAVADQPVQTPSLPIERARNWDEARKLLPRSDGTPDWSKALADGVIDPRPGLDPMAKDQNVMPLNVERIPVDDAAFKAVFPHAAHTVWLSCDNCHPRLFEMAKGAAPITMERIQAGETCGVCHGSVAFGVEACDRCHPVMSGGK